MIRNKYNRIPHPAQDDRRKWRALARARAHTHTHQKLGISRHTRKTMRETIPSRCPASYHKQSEQRQTENRTNKTYTGTLPWSVNKKLKTHVYVHI